MRASAIEELKALRASVETALATLEGSAPSDDDVVVEAFVPARRRTSMPTDPKAWEVSVDW
jgi:hypothetical protein